MYVRTGTCTRSGDRVGVTFNVFLDFRSVLNFVHGNSQIVSGLLCLMIFFVERRGVGLCRSDILIFFKNALSEPWPGALELLTWKDSLQPFAGQQWRGAWEGLVDCREGHWRIW